MANFQSTSVNVRIQLLDSTKSATYTGNVTTAAFIWGAQLEFAENLNDMISDLENYRYTRTRGSSSSYIGVRFGQDSSPDNFLPIDRPFLNTRLLAHKGGIAQDIYINTNNSVKLNADQTADVFVNYKAEAPLSKRWYQLAPYYGSYAHIVNYPTDPTDHVRVGSKQLGKRTSNNQFESVAFYQIPKPTTDTVQTSDNLPGKFYNKGFFETKTIPRIPKFDAAQVMELFTHYKTTRNIDQTKYITLSGNYVYYKAYNWFSITPNTQWSKFAYGSGDQLGPIMREVFEFTDTLSYIQTYKLPPDFQVMNEYITFQRNLMAKRSRYDDYYTKPGNYTSSNSAQIAEVFVNYKTGSWFGKAWYRLAPYYASYTHSYDFPNDYDKLTPTDLTRKNIGQDYYFISSGATEDFQTASGSEDYQVVVT